MARQNKHMKRVEAPTNFCKELNVGSGNANQKNLFEIGLGCDQSLDWIEEKTATNTLYISVKKYDTIDIIFDRIVEELDA